MSINFDGVKELIIPEGDVLQITDEAGEIIWAKNNKVILEVEKITDDTVSGETTYENESFIIYDIYPKKGGVVKVTYGGLTKTIVDSGEYDNPNAQKVGFGTYNGVSDSVETPTSGQLIIEGGYRAFAESEYEGEDVKYDLSSGNYYRGTSKIENWGKITSIPSYAFSDASLIYHSYASCNRKLTDIPAFPPNITIGSYAFVKTSITSIEFKNGAVVGAGAFAVCNSLTSVRIPERITLDANNPFAYIDRDSNFIEIDSNNDRYKMMNNALVDLYTNTLVSGFTDSTIASNIVKIGNWAFSGLSITSMTIPNNVITIGKHAFEDSQLTNIVIPQSVTTIESDAFASSTLTNITMLATTPPTLTTDYIFYKGDTTTITVPKGCGEAYRTATHWTNYADYIVEAT